MFRWHIQGHTKKSYCLKQPFYFVGYGPDGRGIEEGSLTSSDLKPPYNCSELLLAIGT